MKRDELFSRLLQSSGLPKSALNGYALIELIGNEEAMIDGCKGIIEYNEDKISLNLGNVCAAFVGDELEMSSFEDEQATVKGKFLRIEFN